MKKSITQLVSIAFIGGLLGRGLRYAVNVIIARGLGPEALGVFAFGMVIMKASAVISQLGLDRAVQKYVPIYQGDTSRVTGTIVLCVGLSFVSGVLLSVLIYLGRNDINHLSEVGLRSTNQLFIFGIPLFSVMMVGIAATKGFKETRYEVYVRDIGQSSVAVVLVTLGAFVFHSFPVVVVGYLFSLLVGTILVVTFIFDRDEFSLTAKPEFEVREILTFSLPLTLAAVSLYLISWTDILMLGAFVDPAQIGWYQAAFQTSILLTVVLQAGNSIFPAVAADLFHNGQRERLSQIYKSITKWIAYLTVLGYVFLLVYVEEILGIFGTVTTTAEVTLLILGLGQVIATITGPVGFLLTMSGHERLQTANAVVVSIVNVGLNFALIQDFEIIGAALATGISLALLNVLRLVESWYLLGIQPYTLRYWKGAAAIGATAPIMILGRTSRLQDIFLVVFIGCLSLGTFVILIWLFGIDEADKTLIESLD